MCVYSETTGLSQGRYRMHGRFCNSSGSDACVYVCVCVYNVDDITGLSQGGCCVCTGMNVRV